MSVAETVEEKGCTQILARPKSLLPKNAPQSSFSDTYRTKCCFQLIFWALFNFF